MKSLVYLLAMLISSTIGEKAEEEPVRSECRSRVIEQECSIIPEHPLNKNFKQDRCEAYYYRNEVS